MSRLDALAAASIQGTVWAAVAWTACRLLPRSLPRLRALLWWSVSLKTVLLALAPALIALPLLPVVERTSPNAVPLFAPDLLPTAPS
jgi:hypothetical protein